MKRRTYASSAMLLCLLQTGCPASLPVAASCPPPPPAPQAVVEYVTPQKSLIESSTKRWDTLEQEISLTLHKGKLE